MTTIEILRNNLLSPIVLVFVLGVITKLIRSELSLPKDLYASLSIYLLLALGLKGGVELSESSFSQIALPAFITILLGCITPLSTYLIARKFARFSAIDSAALAAHYGSVSAVTFIAANQFVSSQGVTSEGFMPTLLTLLESPGIHIGLAIGALGRSKTLTASPGGASKSTAAVLHEILTGRSMILLVGGLIVGLLIGSHRYEPIKPFFESGFKGALVLFLLEMGIIAGARISDLKRVGARLIALGIAIPLLHGALGAILGHWAGLSVGGSTILAAMSASASYIAAPPAVRVTLPEANPTYYLTASIAVTFPFNLVVGIPLYYRLASWLSGGAA